MRILYIVTAFPRWSGDVITPWLTETITRLRDRGVEVEVLAPSYRGLPDQVVEGVRVHRFRYAPAWMEDLTHDQTAPDRIRERPHYLTLVPPYVVAGALAASRLGRSGRFDAIHAFWPLPHGLLGLYARRTSRLPLVVTFFGVELTWMERQLPFLAPLLARIVRGADAVTTISTYTAGRLTHHVPGAESTIIPFGVTIAPPETIAPANSAGDSFRLLFVGRLVERKGVHILIDALAALNDPGVTLNVLGDGPDRDRLEARVRAAGLQSRVRFHGFVARDVLERHLAECDCFVLPAVVDSKGDTEGLGVVLLEAMSYGKPVIASEAGGITDIVEHRQNGLLVPPGDAGALAAALESMIRKPVDARRMGLQGREDVGRRFSWTVIIDKLAGVYADVVARSQLTNGTRERVR